MTSPNPELDQIVRNPMYTCPVCRNPIRLVQDRFARVLRAALHRSTPYGLMCPQSLQTLTGLPTPMPEC